VVGVPLRIPEAVSNDKPGGMEPEAACHAVGATPPVMVRVEE
jgi:hypothetical protein